MKTLFITLSAACAVVATYFGVRYFTHRDIGFTLARKYVRNLTEKLLRSRPTAAGEAGKTPTTITEQAV